MSSLIDTDATDQTPKPKPENPNVETLKAAFPDVDAAIISAVLIASSNNLEKAFDGLLGMSDPDFKPEPPVVTASVDPVTEEEQRQILADEQFARQLAAQTSHRHRSRDDPNRSRQRRTEPQQAEQERSFLDDDLPVLKENLIQGFNETKLKVGSFISNLRTQYNQRMEANNTNDGERTTHHADMYHQNPRSSTQYDRDAHTLDDDFGELELQDNSHDHSATEVPTSGGIKIPGVKQKDAASRDPAGEPASVGPSRATPSSSRWQPIVAQSPKTATMTMAKKQEDAKSQKKQSESFALGDDDDD